MRLSFDEIETWKQFESLVQAFFETEKATGKKDIINIKIRKSGTGADDGRDLLLDFMITDGIREFERRWIIQCKFYKRDVSTTHLKDNNIPTLIHSYKADGYLLICRQEPTSKLTKMLERLNEECKFNYRYEVWGGEQFLRNIESQNNSTILRRYFPKYFDFYKKAEKAAEAVI